MSFKSVIYIKLVIKQQAFIVILLEGGTFLGFLNEFFFVNCGAKEGVKNAPYSKKKSSGIFNCIIEKPSEKPLRVLFSQNSKSTFFFQLTFYTIFTTSILKHEINIFRQILNLFEK
jgi:hypothetical protein